MATGLRALAVGAAMVVTCVSGAAAGPARDTLRFAEQMALRAERQLPAMERAADAAAERVTAGGALYVAGADRAFASEVSGRAGGLMMIRGLGDPAKATKADVVIVAPSADGDADFCRKLREAGALVIAFGAADGFPADHAFPTLAAKEDGLFAGRDGKRICPTSAVSNVLQVWAWTGEFVAACTRRGKMPTLWQSIMCPGSRERNAALQPLKFHPETKVGPVPAGRLGLAYLRAIEDALRRLQEKECGSLEKIAALVNETRKAGRKTHVWIRGHLPPYVIGGAGDPGLFEKMPAEVKEPSGLAAGDLVLAIGYTGLDEALLAAAEKAGARVAWVIAPIGSLEPAQKRGDVVVDQQWVLGDAVVQVPGYDVPILPPSAVTQLACYWGIVGEAEK